MKGVQREATARTLSLAAALWRPRPAFRALLALPPERRWRIGAGGVLALGALYTATVALLRAGGAQPVARPWLPISRERYYHWLTFLTVPAFLAIWLANAGASQATARRLGGRGSAHDTRAVAGVALGVPLLVTMWLPETAMALLLVSGAVEWERMRDWGSHGGGLVFHNARQAGGIAWMVALSSAALAEVHGLPLRRALPAALAGALAGGVVTAVVIR